ncbi:MAG: peptidylprolyl isomerase [Ardenticatenales bacterium]|nr:peptidylprolyl isomerase [Ardenticatenales bacterium]
MTAALLAAAAACSGQGGLAPMARTDTAPAVPAERDGYYAAGPKDQQLDPANHSYFATVKTDGGDIKFELWPSLAPQNVNAFVFLARAGFYDGLAFHRVIPDFVIQGGDPLGTGLGGPGFGLPAELHADDPVPMRAGAVAMARVSSLPDSAGSQFFIVTGDGQPVQNLTGLYTVIGWVTDGLDVARAVAQGDVMRSVTVTAKAVGASEVSADGVRVAGGDEGAGAVGAPTATRQP